MIGSGIKKPSPPSQGKVGDGPNVMLVQAFRGTSSCREAWVHAIPYTDEF
ncbi:MULTISPECIES: hypothetical protein [unclassified Paenibacillus]|nr:MULTISPECIES: hypothetical protein [unclassified Paenibacillus]